MTIREALQRSPDLPRLDREVLLSSVIGQSRIYLLAHDESRLTTPQLQRYRSFLNRAVRHEPIAYILGEKEFYGRNFSVGPGVLIPRPETELLVDLALKGIEPLTRTKKRMAVVDVGSGSGCIIISLVKSLAEKFQIPDSRFSFFAVDNETAALRYARKNAKRHHIDTSVQFVKSNLLSRLVKKLSDADELFIIANLPYLSGTLYQSTAPNVKDYEPKSALLSGADGLDHYRRLIAQLLALRKNGLSIRFFLEISPEQAPKLAQILARIDTLSTLEIIPDLAKKPRVVAGTLFVPYI